MNHLTIVNTAVRTFAQRKEKRMSLNARSKGQRGEREVVKLLQTIVDIVTTRYAQPPIVLQRNALQAHLGGCDLHGLDGFAVEVKFCENEQLNQWWAQTLRQAEKLGAVPVLMFRARHQPWKVKLRAYVNTPGDKDQHEMDMLITVEEFLAWFEDAFSERYRQGCAACDRGDFSMGHHHECPKATKTQVLLDLFQPTAKELTTLDPVKDKDYIRRLESIYPPENLPFPKRPDVDNNECTCASSLYVPCKVCHV